jgi:hypothetical protein
LEIFPNAAQRPIWVGHPCFNQIKTLIQNPKKSHAHTSIHYLAGQQNIILLMKRKSQLSVLKFNRKSTKWKEINAHSISIGDFRIIC